jgi:LPXTG-site transpeptidase (sortase) family protein
MHEYPTEIHRLLKIGGPTEDHAVSHAIHPVIHPTQQNSAVLERAGLDADKLKNLLAYLVIFIVAFLFFYVVLNFSSLIAQVEGWFSKPQSAQILGNQEIAYNRWINNYFYAIGDRKLLEPTADFDKDGLSNLDEFIIKTNPIVTDSDNDGFSDGIEIINNQNPWGNGPETLEQRKLAQDLNLIMINNRVSYNVSQNKNSGLIAGANTKNFNLDTQGRISIPKLNLQVPLIWSKDPSNFDADLTKGVIHYPGTALPGENGIVYISGHSSDYLWKRNPMHNVFAKLNFLSAGDDIFIDVYGKDGKVYNFRYKVQGSKTYSADDQKQFIDNTGSKLNLSTCWPIGTQKDRLVVTAVPVAL